MVIGRREHTNDRPDCSRAAAIHVKNFPETGPPTIRPSPFNIIRTKRRGFTMKKYFVIALSLAVVSLMLSVG
jgi:hypothetical protein